MVTYEPITNTICLNRCDCDPCSSVQSCPNCSTQPPCPIPIGLDGEDLQSNVNAFNVTPAADGGDFPSSAWNTRGLNFLRVEIQYGNSLFADTNLTYRGSTATAVEANLATDLEAWLATTLGGGAWTVTTAPGSTPQGTGFVISSVTGVASPSQLIDMELTEGVSGDVSFHEFDNANFQDPCIAALADSTLFQSGGATHTPTSNACEYEFTQVLPGCGSVTSTFNFFGDAMEQAIRYYDESGVEIANATYTSGNCAPYECDRAYRLALTAQDKGQNPGGGDLIAWPAFTNYNVGSSPPTTPCRPPDPVGTTTTQCWISSPTATPALPNDIPGSFRFDLVTDAGSYSTVVTYSGTDCTVAGQELGTGLENWMAATIGGTWLATITVLGSVAPFCDVRVDNLTGTGSAEQIVSLQITRDSSDGASVTFDSWSNTLTVCADTSVCYASSPSATSTPSLPNDIAGSYRLNVTTSRTTYSNLFPYTGSDCTLAQTQLRGGIETWLNQQLGGIWNVTVSILNGNVAPLCDVRIDNITGSGHTEQINNIEIIRESSDEASSSFTGWTNTVIPCDNGGGGEPPDPDPTPTECNGETLDAILQCELNPPNPCLVSVNASASTSGLCTSVNSITLVAKGSTTQSIPMPLAGDVVDLSAFEGQTVTLCLEATFTCGPDTLTETRECTVNVPNFTSDRTLDTSQPVNATNDTTLLGAIANLQNGGRLTIAPGTYQLPVGSSASFSGKQNVCVTSPGVATIDGNFFDTSPDPNDLGEDRLIGEGPQTSQYAVRANNVSNTLFENLRIQNARRRGVNLENSNDVVFRNVHVDTALRSVENNVAQSGVGISISSSDRIKVIGCEIENIPTGPGIQVINNSEDTLVLDCNSHDNNDGFLQQSGIRTRVYDSSFSNNRRQGILSAGTNTFDSIFENNDIFLNIASGVQLENGARQQVIRGNRIYNNNRYRYRLDRLFWTSGEHGIWVDDTVGFLIEDNVLYGNHGIIQIAPGSEAASATGEVLDGIVRFNRAFANNAQFSRGGPDPSDTSLGRPRGSRHDGLGMRHSRNIRIYHNTFDDNGSPVGARAEVGNGIILNPQVQNATNPTIPNSNVTWVNNIVSRTRTNENTARVTTWARSGAEFDRIDGNIYYMPPSGSQYLLAGSSSFRLGWDENVNQNDNDFTDHNFASYQAAMSGIGESNSVEANPQLGANHQPLASSPAIGNAVPLTTVTATSGTVVGLNEPAVFWPGDLMQFADGSTATVVTVNSANIVLGQQVPASVAAGQGVTLFRCDGANDIGAVQV